MKSVQFIFGIHNHQPVGNFDYVFEEVLKKSYQPFIDVVENHPSIAITLHFSGCLMEWLEDHYPTFIDRIYDLIKRKNVEMLSSGFYEPILAVIPDHDKLGQIEKMNIYIQQRFHYKPSGLWLTERVWEPHLAKAIRKAGIDYVAVDDFHFLASGITGDKLTGYFTTEDQGYTLGVFPINQKLRYAIPFEDPEKTIEILQEYATEDGNNLIVMTDDGEKFGLWPGTHGRCFGRDKWLEKFFCILEKNQDWLKTTTFKEYSNHHLPKGRVALASTSYFEMNEWTLPAKQGEAFRNLVNKFNGENEMDKVRPYLRGGTWRNFLSIYDEANWMHRRVIEISNTISGELERGNKNLKEAQDELWRSQCNCAYWHGIFGGLYLPHLRHAVYTHLLAAEDLLNLNSGFNNKPRDIDGDGAKEYQLKSNDLRLIISERGGIIKEFDYMPKNFNLLNTMRRYHESYHSQISATNSYKNANGSIHNIVMSKEPGFNKHLYYDQWQRKMLLDHFVPKGTKVTQMKTEVPEKGNFIDRYFTVENKDPLIFSRIGIAFGHKLKVQKRVSLDSSTVGITITVSNLSKHQIRGLYGCELNFSLLGGHTPDRYYVINKASNKHRYLDITANKSKIVSLQIINEWDKFQVSIHFKDKTNVWLYPVETINMSESGFEKVYQSSVVIPYWTLDLNQGDSLTCHFSILLEGL